MRFANLVLSLLVVLAVSAVSFAQYHPDIDKVKEKGQSASVGTIATKNKAKTKRAVARKRQPASIGNPIGVGGTVTAGKSEAEGHPRPGKIKP